MKSILFAVFAATITFYSFGQEKFILLDEDDKALTLYFKDGRFFHLAAKPYEGHTFQQWEAQPTRDGFYHLRNPTFNKCLYYDFRNKTAEVTSCQITAVQEWKMEGDKLINKQTGEGLFLYPDGNRMVPVEKATPLTRIKMEKINLSTTKITSKMESLGPSINTIYPEVMPVISGDGNQLFFMRKELTEDKKITANIYSSLKVSTTRWGKAYKFPEPLNNRGRNYVCSASTTGETLLLGNEYHEDGTVSQGVSITHFKNGAWTFPEPIEIEDFENKSGKAEYSLSFDDKVLMMAVEMERGIGQRDLYVSFKNEDGTFTAPKNLGEQINTRFQEDAPFLAADRKTLFFSSNGLPGYGSHDLFMTKRLDSTWTNWSKPVNLGSKINSENWEAYFMVDSKAEYAYVVVENDRTIGKSDIFRIELPPGYVSDQVFSLKVSLLDKFTGKNVEGAMEFYENKSTEFDRRIISDHYQGYFYKDQSYAMLVMADGYVPYAQEFTFNADEEQEIKVLLMPIGSASLTKLENLQFDFDKMKVNPIAFRELDMIASVLKKDINLKAEIYGHTDNAGEEDYNQKLSEGRAKTVYDYLITKGIGTDQLSYKGFGESKPVATNDTEEGRALNRRVEFKLVSKE